MTENSNEYNRKYLSDKMQRFFVFLQKDDFDYVDGFCNEIGESHSQFLKRLINEELIRHGKEPIIANRNAPSDKEAIGDLIPASQYAKAHNINRTTMIMRCKKGQYQTAQQIEGKWYIDPNEESL